VNPDEITEEIIRAALAAHPNPLVPSQRAVSLPVIKRCVQLMQLGTDLGELLVKLDENAVVDGHHRYISHVLLNTEPELREYIRPEANFLRTWDVVLIDEVDWHRNHLGFR
jgi:hypothetical protein